MQNPLFFHCFRSYKEHLMKKQIPRMVNQSLKGVAPFAIGRLAELLLAHMGRLDTHSRFIRGIPTHEILPKDIAFMLLVIKL